MKKIFVLLVACGIFYPILIKSQSVSFNIAPDTTCNNVTVPCTSETLVEWDVNPCQVGNSSFWTGFSPSYPGLGGCTAVSASSLFRNTGGNSCAPGRPGGDGGFCAGGFGASSWSSNDPEAIRFNVNFGASDTGTLTALNFWELAATPAIFSNGNSQNNNYPTLYGVRVLKNGVEIFLQSGVSTSQSWSLQSFDFSSDPDFAYNGTTTFQFELFAYAPVGNGYSSYIWDIDDISVEGCCGAGSEAEIYCEGFNYPDGTTISTEWTFDVAGANLSDGGHFEVRNNSFSANDIDGTEAVWASSLINVSAYSNVNISVDLSSNGALETADYINVYYSLDGGPEIALTNGLQTDNFTAITATASNLNGSTLQIIIRTKNSQTDEFYYFDNVCVHGTPVCIGTGAVALTVSGGTPPYSFLWSNGETTANISNLCYGTYLVTVSDASGFTSQNSVAVICAETDSCALSLNPVVTNETCSGINDGTINLNVSGGTTPYLFVWSNGETSNSISNLQPGDYSVIATDSIGCSVSDTFTVSAGIALTVTIQVSNPIACNGGATGELCAQVSGGNTPYSFVWSNSATTQCAAGLSAGIYAVTVTDANGCQGSVENFQLDEPSALNLNSTIINAGCSGAPDGSIDLAVSGGTSAYSFLWSNGETTEDISSLAAGIYDVVVTDANGCTISASITVNGSSAMTLSIAWVDIRCAGANDGIMCVQVTDGTPPYSYIWSNLETTDCIDTLAAGNYSVTVTDSTGCSSIASGVVSEPQALSISIATTNISCFGAEDGSVDVTSFGGTSPYFYLWSFGGTDEDYIGIAGPGNATLTVTDANGCVAYDSVTMTQPDSLIVSITITTISCFSAEDGSVDVTPVGGTPSYSYLWSFGGTDEDYIGIAGPGNATLTVTDANGCNAYDSITMTQPDLLVASVATTNVSCFGGNDGTVSITVSGGTAPYSFIWSNGAVTEDLNGVNAGNYSVTITDFNGCTATISTDINQPTPLALGALPFPVSCFGGNDGAIDLFASGGSPSYSFSWSNGESTEDIAGLIAGDYTVIVADGNGCSATIIIPIQEPVELSLTAIINNVSTAGGSDGSIDLSVIGGTSPYSFLWSSGNTAEDISNLSAGTYFVTVTDDNGCAATDSFIIADPFRIGAFKISASPNPFSDRFFIDITHDRKSKGSVSLFDLFGKRLMEENIEIEKGLNRNVMTVNQLPSGLYFLQVKMDGEIKVLKIERH